jgi:curved DNA-binding protein CbpA
MPNFYEVLGLEGGAEPGEIEAAFQRLAKSVHSVGDTDGATEEKHVKEVKQAYVVLSDPETRIAYDWGLVHKHAETHRRVLMAMLVTAASLMVTVGCTFYFLLPNVGRKFAGSIGEGIQLDPIAVMVVGGLAATIVITLVARRWQRHHRSGVGKRQHTLLLARSRTREMPEC